MKNQKKKTPNLQSRRKGTPVEDEVKEIMAAATAEPETKPTEEPTPTPVVVVHTLKMWIGVAKDSDEALSRCRCHLD